MNVTIKFKAGQEMNKEASYVYDVLFMVAKEYAVFGNIPTGFYMIDTPTGAPVNPNQELPLRGGTWHVFFEGNASDLLIAEVHPHKE